MSWTDERVETLRQMWIDGKSASQIAKELGGVSRNAVIGKVHRLGLSNRGGNGEGGGEDVSAPAEAEAAPEPSAVVEPDTAYDGTPEPAAAAPRPVREQPPVPRPRIPGQPLPPQPSGSEISAEALANLAEVAKRARKLSLMQLTERTCKWPVGDPATEEFWFCGLPAAAGKPYCEAHVAVAFQPMSARRDRRAGGR